MARQSSKSLAASEAQKKSWPFGRKNYIWFVASLVVIALGFILLSTGDTTLAPVLLVVGYCVLLPISILVRSKAEPGSAETDDSDA